MKYSKDDKAQALETIRARLAAIPVDAYGKRTIYGCVKHVSRSGMMREIELYTIDSGELCRLSWSAACALDWPLGKSGGVRVSGCGMDMIFHLVDCVMASIGNRSDWQSEFRISQI